MKWVASTDAYYFAVLVRFRTLYTRGTVNRGTLHGSEKYDAIQMDRIVKNETTDCCQVKRIKYLVIG